MAYAHINTVTKRLEGYSRRNHKLEIGVFKQGYDYWLYNVDNVPLTHWRYLGRNFEECKQSLDENDAIEREGVG